MKKLLVVVMLWSASLGAMEDVLQQQQQPQAQEEMVKIEFYEEPTQEVQAEESASAAVGEKRRASDVLAGELPTKKQKTEQPQKEQDVVSLEIPKRYALMSSVMKQFLEDTGSNVMLLEARFKEGIDLLSADQYEYWRQAYDASQKIDSNEQQKMINQMARDLAIRSPKQVGAIGNTANFLDIPILEQIALYGAFAQLFGDNNQAKSFQQQFFADPTSISNPWQFNHSLWVRFIDALKNEATYTLTRPQNLGVQGKAAHFAWSSQGQLALEPAYDEGRRSVHVDVGQGYVNIYDVDRTTGKLTLQYQPDLVEAAGIDLEEPFYPVHHGAEDPLYDVYSVSLAFNPDGNLLAAGIYNGTIQLWEKNSNDGTWHHIQTLEQYEDGGTGYLPVAFDVTGKVLFAGSDDGIIKIWKKNADGTWTEAQQFTAHEAKIFDIVSASNTFVSLGEDRLIAIWKIKNDGSWDIRFIDAHPQSAKLAVALSPDANILAVAGEGKTDFFELDAAGEWSKTGSFIMRDKTIHSLDFDPSSNNRLAIGSKGVDLVTKKDGKWEVSDTLLLEYSMPFVKFSSQQHGMLAAVTGTQNFYLWRIPAPELIKFLQQHASLEQLLLLMYARKLVYTKKIVLDIATYPNLRQLYQSFGDIGGQGQSKYLFEVIKPLVIDSAVQQQQTSTVTGLVGTAASSNNNNTTNDN